jgi:SEC-C motif-containing protein
MAAANCPCGSDSDYARCCGPYLDGKLDPPDAEALMRSRYTACTRNHERYLLASWHASTRPETLGLDPAIKWLGLDVKQHRHDVNDADRAVVEFIARFRSGGGRAARLHEVSRFVREEGRWFYVDGDVDPNNVQPPAASARD